MHFRNPDALVTTDWLEQHLADPDLRIFDCSTQLLFEVGTSRPYRVVGGAEDHNVSHIPGAGVFDLQTEFSDPDSPFSMTLPAPSLAAEAFAKHGIGDNTRVVLYSRRSLSWSTRFWWMLRWIGFDNAAILDGGFEKWEAEGKPLSTEPCAYRSATLAATPRPEIFVGKSEVLNAIDDPDVCTISALGPDIHSGENDRYGRPGRVPGSVNVPQIDLVLPGTLQLRSAGEISEHFAKVGAQNAERHITYCGGGIFATMDAFALHQLGHDNIAVYDNSMSEWGKDIALPIEVD